MSEQASRSTENAVIPEGWGCAHADAAVVVLMEPFGAHRCQDCGEMVEAVWRAIPPGLSGGSRG